MSSATRATDIAGLPKPLIWRAATVVENARETPSANTLVLELPGWPGHRAGQHVDVRLTAEDGYQAQRSYSIASAPEDKTLAITVEQLADGEVSPYLTDVVQPGDALELRGPIGGWFTWQASDGGPLMLVGGGSGLVPLMAMVRHRAAAGSDAATRLLVSARNLDALIYADELESRAAAGDGLETFITLTRAQPGGWTGLTGRVDRDMLRRAVFDPVDRPRVFVCGPTPFVESVSEQLVALGHDPGRIKTERFGPSGGQI